MKRVTAYDSKTGIFDRQIMTRKVRALLVKTRARFYEDMPPEFAWPVLPEEETK